LHAGTIGNFYTLSKTEDVPAFSDSTMMAVSCNGSDIALSCMGGGFVGNTSAFYIKYMRLYPYWSNTCNGRAYNSWGTTRPYELHIRCFDPTY